MEFDFNQQPEVTVENYQQLAMSTCLPSAMNWGYARHGFKAELYELKAKKEGKEAKKIRDGEEFDEAKHIEKIKDEVGDCLWFIALKCELSSIKFEDLCNNKLNENNLVEIEIMSDFIILKFECAEYGIDYRTCMQRNIDKLFSRKLRGVLKGSGDDR